VRDETGIRLELVDGLEEGRLIHLAITRHVTISEPAMFVDIGGGSVEVGLLDAGGIIAVESLKAGTVRLLEMFGRDAPDPSQLRQRIESYAEATADHVHDDMVAGNCR